MTTRVVVLALTCGLVVACLPNPKDGGEVLDSGNNEAEGDAEGDDGVTVTGDDDGPTTANDDGGSTGATGSTGGTVDYCADYGLDESLAIFADLSAEADQTYWYEAPTVFNGFEDDVCGYRTIVEVVQGEFARRTFEITSVLPDFEESDCGSASFVEEAGEINTQMSIHAVPARSLEDIYAGCCELLSVEPDDDYVKTFQVHPDGLVRACAARFANCDDGCETSVDGFGTFLGEEIGFGPLPR